MARTRQLVFAALTCTAFFARTTSAAPVEYVKVCSVVGAGYFYVPGTDRCLNPVTGEIRRATAYGTVQTFPIRNQRWIGNKAKICENGSLVELPAHVPADFTLQDDAQMGHHWRTAGDAVSIPPGSYVDSIFFLGSVTPGNTLTLRVYVDQAGSYISSATTVSEVPGSGALYRVSEPRLGYFNASASPINATAFLGDFEGYWGNGQAATAAFNGVTLTAVTVGATGNGLSVQFSGTAAVGSPYVSAVGQTITVYYVPGETTFGDLGPAFASVSSLVSIDLTNANSSSYLSDFISDPNVTTFSGGADFTSPVTGEINAGFCLRSITEPTEADLCSEAIQSAIATAAANYAPASLSASVASVTATADSLSTAVSSLTDQLSVLESDAASCSESLALLTERVSALESDAASSSAALTALSNRISQLEAQLAALPLKADGEACEAAEQCRSLSCQAGTCAAVTGSNHTSGSCHVAGGWAGAREPVPLACFMVSLMAWCVRRRFR
jgi:hypothetical protein